MNKGFTLIELLLYTALASLIILAISAFWPIALQTKVKSQTIAEVEQQGLMAMQTIAQTIRNSQSITAPAISATGSALTLVVPIPSKSPTIFSLLNGVLQMQEGSGALIPLTNTRVEVSNLVFQNLSRPSTYGNIRISFSLNFKNTSGKNDYQYNQNFYESASLR